MSLREDLNETQMASVHKTLMGIARTRHNLGLHDAEDAVQDAWLRICTCSIVPDEAYAVAVGKLAIQQYAGAHHGREITVSIDDIDEGTISP